MNNVTPESPTALVVEDDHLMLNMLHEVLEHAGFQTTAVDHGQAALTMLTERCFDVLVVDVNLPDMNGMAIGELARKQYQGRIAIVVITGFNVQNRRVSSLQLGADDFLGKPFDLDELIARIESKLRTTPNDEHCHKCAVLAQDTQGSRAGKEDDASAMKPRTPSR